MIVALFFFEEKSFEIKMSDLVLILASHFLRFPQLTDSTSDEDRLIH